MEILNRYRENKRTLVTFKCGCGVVKTVREDQLKVTKSCGCYRRIYMKLKRTGMSPSNKRHGETNKTPEYRAWSHIKSRCYNSNCKDYKDYGGRGITMHPHWLTDYPRFLSDIGRKPNSSYSLDRINVNGNYEPSNVRWATTKEQANNKRTYYKLFHLN